MPGAKNNKIGAFASAEDGSSLRVFPRQEFSLEAELGSEVRLEFNRCFWLGECILSLSRMTAGIFTTAIPMTAKSLGSPKT